MDDGDGRRRCSVFGMGGTIAMATAGGGGVVPALSADQLLDRVPGLLELRVGLEVADVRRLPGAALGFDDLTDLTAAIAQAVAAGVDGVVVIQGTDTIEETAYLLDLHHHSAVPLVVTGAMRNPNQAGADGPANLLAAITTATAAAARGYGALVVLADEIHAASRVRKTHTCDGGAFTSPNGGPLGNLVEGTPHLFHRPHHRHLLPAGRPGHAPRIALLTAVLDDDGAILDGLTGRVDGLVVAGFGAGHVPPSWAPILSRLAGDMPVVLSSRTGAGSVFTNTYGFAGSERDLIASGLIPAGFLDPLKARILLRAMLAAGANPTQISAGFAAAGGHRQPDMWPWADGQP